ncbi:hypothetical protein EJ03DRAFT_330423 [Teratosphaeria nubilosa]|uniref:GET complex, subunit GET2 n=1 Tax=Teratosphaeria nubilosa TaxID=161662 RepID=A0A6G1KZK0_9PEZI|nr:hypothetical protein EJ03DRAFT_330423 [Teratosphaeria nubilosa]
MADTAASTTNDPILENETPNQKAARLRREKRQKKMAEQGEDRLAKIKALNGGVAPPAEVLGGPTVPPPQTHQASVDDPDEVDIDTVSGTHTPATRGNANNNDPFAAMMQIQQQRQQQQQGGAGGEAEDPMVQMMTQLSSLMGGNPQNPNDPNQPPQIPPMLQAMLRGQSQDEKQAAKAPERGGAYFWRLVHAVFASSLAIYITLTSTFNGTKLGRTQSAYSSDGDHGFGQRLFVIFTSAELVLQSTRFFVEKGQLRGNGWLAMVANSGFVPEPYAGWVRVVGRYATIAQTVFSDAMGVIFVFGVLVWWRGMEVA